jgi:hypothetical protein
MAKQMRLRAGEVAVEVELNETETAEKVFSALPVEARAQTWGDEIYFSIPLECDEENPHEVVEVGDVGFWPPGSALCFFFGKTPASRGDEIRPASAVNIIGHVRGDPKVLKAVRAGTPVAVERLE